MPADTDALNSKQFTLLYIGALHIESRDRRIKAIYIIVCAGLLGMRRIEILHLREKWIDWRIGKIEMPALDPCSCSQCWGAARDKWLREGFNELQSQGAYGDNDSFGDIDNTELLEKLDSGDLCEILYKTRFSPKNDEGRTIPFGWSKRVTAALIVFFDEIGPFLDKSPKTVENFVEEAAENAEQLEPDVVQPHGLRKTGVNFFADQGFGDRILRRTVGQDGRNSLPHYLHDSYRYNTHIFYHIFDKEDEAPPVVSEGEKPFPVAHEEKRFKNEPFDPTHYDENRRFTRAKDQEDTNHHSSSL